MVEECFYCGNNEDHIVGELCPIRGVVAILELSDGVILEPEELSRPTKQTRVQHPHLRPSWQLEAARRASQELRVDLDRALVKLLRRGASTTLTPVETGRLVLLVIQHDLFLRPRQAYDELAEMLEARGGLTFAGYAEVAPHIYLQPR